MHECINYLKILKFICDYYGIKENDIEKLFKNSEQKYIILLALKTNNCLDIEGVIEKCGIKDLKQLNSYVRKAEEKLLINIYFRKKYFSLEENIKKLSDM